MMPSRLLALVSGLLLLAATAPLAADDRSIVIESYEGARPADATKILAPIYAELRQRGYVGGDALVAVVRDRLSADPGSLSPNDVVAAQKDVEHAFTRFVDGDYGAALELADKALDRYATAPAVLAREDALRASQFRAMVIAARSAQLVGRNDEAFQRMAEAIRTFNGQRPSPTDFDPQVIALHRQVSDELAKQGVGVLEIRASDPAVVLFVDERFVGTGSARLDGLPPGKYRVLAVKAEQPGRVHVVEIPARGHATVDIAWDIDGAIATGPGFVSVTESSEVMASALALARSLGAPRVVVLGIRTVGARRAVVGYGIHVESQTRSYAAVQIEPLMPADETMRRLGALLAGDKAVSTSDLITTEPSLAEPHGLGARRKTALAVGAAALIAGGVAVAFDVSAHDTYDASTREPDDAKQATLFDDSNRKYHLAQGLAIAGAVGIAAAAALWFTEPERAEGIVVGAAPSSDGLSVVVSGRF